MSGKVLTKEVWNKIRENNKQLRDTIDKIEIDGITVEQYQKRYPRLSRLINLEEVKKMKLVNQTINVPEALGKKKTKAATAILVPEGHITPKELAKELKTSAKDLRKVIRRLKLVRTGKQWHWDPENAELNIIRNAFAKSKEAKPTTPIAKIKAQAVVEPILRKASPQELAEDIPQDPNRVIIPRSM